MCSVLLALLRGAQDYLPHPTLHVKWRRSRREVGDVACSLPSLPSLPHTLKLISEERFGRKPHESQGTFKMV